MGYFSNGTEAERYFEKYCLAAALVAMLIK